MRLTSNDINAGWGESSKPQRLAGADLRWARGWSARPSQTNLGEVILRRACGKHSRMQFETYGGFLPGRRVQIEPWAELAASDPGAKWTEGSHRGGIGHVVTEGHFKGLRGSCMSVHRPCVSPGQENKMRRTSLFFFCLFFTKSNRFRNPVYFCVRWKHFHEHLVLLLFCITMRRCVKV